MGLGDVKEYTENAFSSLYAAIFTLLLIVVFACIIIALINASSRRRRREVVVVQDRGGILYREPPGLWRRMKMSLGYEDDYYY